MKKLSYIILGFLIGALATYYFCPRSIETGEGNIKIIKPKGVITQAEAKALNSNWTKYRQAAVDTAIHKQNPNKNKDYRSTWWSLDEVENYLAYAKQQSDSLGYNMSGIRVYLGVYGKNAGNSKKDYTTMFIVPTGKKSHSKASMNVISFQGGNNDIPTLPLNAGTGGDGSYSD